MAFLPVPTRWAPRATTARVAAAALAASALLYARGLDGEFVLDDRSYFVENDDIPRLGLRGAATVFTRPTNFWGEFLPVRDLLFVVEYAAFGRNPFGYHAVSIALYAAACTLCFLLLRELGRAEPRTGATERLGAAPAALGAALFLVHPVHVECVAYVTGQKDLLSGVFVLGSLVAFARAFASRERRALRVAIGGLLYGLAVLSKLPAIVLAVLVPVLYLVSDRAVRPAPGRAALVWILINVPAALWFVTGARALYAVETWAATAARGDVPFVDRLPLALKILGAHARLAVWPRGLSFGYPFDGSPGVDANLVAGVLAIVAVAAIAAAYRREPAVVLGATIFLVGLLPALRLQGALNNESVFDRYLFLPVLGVAVFAERLVRALAVERLGAPRAYGASLAVLALARAAATLDHVPAFADDVAATRNTYERYPGWSRAPFELAYSLVEAGRVAEARALLEEDASLGSPPWVRPYFEGWIALKEGRTDAAIRSLGWAQHLALAGGYFPFPSVPLGEALLATGRADEAERQLRLALEAPIFMPIELYHARALLAEIERRRRGPTDPGTPSPDSGSRGDRTAP